MRARTIALLILGLAIVVTVAASGLALSRGGTGEASRPALGLGSPSVALIRIDGAIDDAMVAPERGGRENVYAQLRRAERDPNVRAVVLRINSPGGSAAASQQLYDGVRRLQAADKKVVAYFADVAASGGYYVGAAADRIVSQPAAITGSIGVIISTLDLSGLYEKVGVRERVIKSGPYKDILSPGREITPEERVILDKLIGDTLDQFVKVVAAGRNLPEDEVRRVADGRIVSGTEAVRLKLVDEVGDQTRAVALAAELAGLRGEPRVELYESPRQPGLLGLLGSAVLGGLWPSAGALEEHLPRPGIQVRYEWRG